ncbi:hypothetical protein GOBAR_DD20973 [Gossypium barbadense]|nr:hypothetical protein GOBAR_DD20973 [Gossypium barbadense]
MPFTPNPGLPPPTSAHDRHVTPSTTGKGIWTPPTIPWRALAKPGRHCNVAAAPLSLSLRPQLCLLLREAENCNVVGTPLGVVLCPSAIISLM